MAFERNERQGRQSPDPRRVETGRGRILVVDDDVLVGRGLMQILSHEYDVNFVEDAEQALMILRQGTRFDVVLCDLMMPRMTGPELYGAVLRLAPEQAARFVFMTAAPFSDGARKFLESVPNHWFEKPFDLDGLRALCQSLVAARESVLGGLTPRLLESVGPDESLR